MMTELRFERFRMPGADLGPENPLPALQALDRAHGHMDVDKSVPEEARKHLGYGSDCGILPYGIQDGYDRNRKERDFRVAVLENDLVRAMFLLELGGRLWSLVHKPSNRELLYRNPVFQPGNLAVRNAWFSGGVEWNCSVPGHTPLTCSPVFAARLRADDGVRGADGSPVLRLYEWERIRRVPYQMDFWLPENSPWLFAHMRILNPHDAEIPMYWWSNIAVPEAPGSRVLVPTDAAYSFGYTGLMTRVPVPVYEGRDNSYPTNFPSAWDFFYDIPKDRRPWITSLDADGRGLIQTSTKRLRGRKLFVWGMGAGGRHWQEFLSVPGRPYVEIQAGLGQTQMECLPMPAKTEWSWLEAYGYMEAEPALVHGKDWAAAWGDVETRLDRQLPVEQLERAYSQAGRTAQRPPDEVVHRGSGWGALEQLLGRHAAQPLEYGKGLVFDEASLGEEQATPASPQTPWRSLLEQGELPCREPDKAPGAWMVQQAAPATSQAAPATSQAWYERLKTAVAEGRGDHWLSWLHLGVMAYSAGETDAARRAWEWSLKLKPSAWALRNLAVAAQHRKEVNQAADLWAQAQRLLPGEVHLAIECARALIAATRFADVLALCENAPAHVHENPRLRFLRAQAQLETGHLDDVEQFLEPQPNAPFAELPDVREGEVSLSDLWFGLHEKRLAAEENVPITDALKQRVKERFPPPPWIDFRMEGS